jgi:WD40 repeat protein
MLHTAQRFATPVVSLRLLYLALSCCLFVACRHSIALLCPHHPPSHSTMSGRFTTSKYRHAVGAIEKKENWYPDITPAASAPSDAELLAVNTSFLAVSWQVNGAIGVLPLGDVGKRAGREVPLIHAHSGHVYEIVFNPFDDTQLLSSGDDGFVRLWQLESGVGLSQNLGSPAAVLAAHTKRVSTIRYHPSAAGVVASGSHDGTTKIWDVGTQVFSSDSCYTSMLHHHHSSFSLLRTCIGYTHTHTHTLGGSIVSCCWRLYNRSCVECRRLTSCYFIR